jgi:hypothetical protein
VSRKLANWLTSYLDFVSETESPVCYHTWCGVSALCSTLKRNVWMKRDYLFFPNQYVILVGPPAVGKGAAINPMRDLVKKANTVNYLPDRWTAERIIEKLSIGFTTPSITTQNGVIRSTLTQDASATIISTELPVFLGSSDWMLPFLCEMWDRGSYDYHTKLKGNHTVDNLCTSLIGGCVPDYIRYVNKDSSGIVTGGFASRCIYVYADKPAKELPWPVSKVGSQLELDLVDDLKTIAMTNGEMQWSATAKSTYTKYYHDCGQNGKFEQAVVAHFKARARVHVLKTAIALSVAESDALVLEETHLNDAIKMVEQVQNDLDRTFRFVGSNRELEATQNIMAYLEYKGEASLQEIMANNYRFLSEMSTESLQRILDVLVTMQFCVLARGMYKILQKGKKP